MTVFALGKDIVFPNPELSDEDGLLAVGGDLSIERLLLAYSNGIFPWYDKNTMIMWWCLKPRFILYPSKVKISKSMSKIIKNILAILQSATEEMTAEELRSVIAAAVEEINEINSRVEYFVIDKR